MHSDDRKYRALYGRKRRGSNRSGLKVGKKSIREMGAEEIALFLRQLQNRLKSRQGCKGQKKQYKRLRRLISLIRNKKQIQKPFTYIRSELLESFYPDRTKKWLKKSKRKPADPIKLEGFSFIDHPIQTIENLRKIAEVEATGIHGRINFEDKILYDLGPYVVLALMRESMYGIFKGGKMSTAVAGAIKAVDLQKPLRMGKMPPADPAIQVFPFKLRSRRGTGSSKSDNIPSAESSEEKVSVEFVSTLEEWLQNQERQFSLTSKGKKDVYGMLLEVLDNAKRHSDPINKDGQWHIAGLMEGPFLSDDQEDVFFKCNLTIISLGSTIYESLQTAPPDKRIEIEKYVAMHKNKDIPDEILWNVSALQDGISRCEKSDDNPSNGYGFCTALSSFCNLISFRKNEEIQPVMSIISGKSCIMIKYPYSVSNNDEGYRVIAFNEKNALAEPPDGRYLKYLPVAFPGTLITTRFFLGAKHLDILAKKNDTD